jgi:hypothetical protein
MFTFYEHNAWYNDAHHLCFDRFDDKHSTGDERQLNIDEIQLWSLYEAIKTLSCKTKIQEKAFLAWAFLMQIYSTLGGKKDFVP